MEYDNIVLGQAIRNLRKKKNISQETFSGLAGISRTHLSMIETGTKHPNLETIWKIANAFDMRTSDLIRIIEDSIINNNK